MKYKLCDNIIYDNDQISKEEFLLHMETGKILSLNEGASFIISRIVKGMDLQEIIRETMEDCEDPITYEQVKSDFSLFVNMLLESSFLEEIQL